MEKYKGKNKLKKRYDRNEYNFLKIDLILFLPIILILGIFNGISLVY